MLYSSTAGPVLVTICNLKSCNSDKFLEFLSFSGADLRNVFGTCLSIKDFGILFVLLHRLLMFTLVLSGPVLPIFACLWPRLICQKWKQKQLQQASSENSAETVSMMDAWIEKVLEELQRVGLGCDGSVGKNVFFLFFLNLLIHGRAIV